MEFLDKIFIQNARFIATMNPKRSVIENGAIVIEDEKIVAVGKTEELKRKYKSDLIIDGEDMLVTPGLIDSHLHLESCYEKGLLDDQPCAPWVEKYINFNYGSLSSETYYNAVQTTLLQCVKNGTTTVGDCGTVQTLEEAPIKAVTDMGMRAVLSRCLMDIHGATKTDYVSYDAFTDLAEKLRESTDQCLSRSEDLIKRYNGAAEGRIRVSMDLQQVCNSTPELCRGVRKLADEYGVVIMTHANVTHDMREMTRKRFGMGDIEYLEKHEAVCRNLLAAHMAWTPINEIYILKERGANVSHQPGSSAHGVYSALSRRGTIPEMVKAGVNVSLGTDDMSTGCRHDIVREMALCATIHAEVRHPYIYPDPDLFMLRTADPSPKVLEMATLNAARSLMLEKEIGSLEPGKKADITLWDLTYHSWVPVTKYNLFNNFVYMGTGASAHTVIVNGKIVMQNRKIKTINEKTLIKKVQAHAEKYQAEAPWVHKPETWELKWMRE